MKIDIGAVNYDTRVKLSALVLLVLTASYTNLSYTRDNRGFDRRSIGKDEVTMYDRRFEELRKALPKRGLVGYVHDQTDEVETIKAYYLTQYALAPIMVVHGIEPDLVVGNFSYPSEETGKSVPDDLIPIQNFGNGVILFRKEAR
jgi:hypothetical protein